MPKLITNPLRQGLPSKMYLLAFPETIKGYAMAKKIQGIKDPLPYEKRRKHTPQTSKIYENINERKNLFKKNKAGCLSKSTPLFNEIEKKLQEYDIDLSGLEKHVLKKVLNSNPFRKFVGIRVKEIDFEYDVDASGEIMRVLGDFCFWTTIEKKPDNFPFNSIEEFEQLWKLIETIEKDEKVGIKMKGDMEKVLPLFHDEKIKEGLKIALGEEMPQDEEIINVLLEGKKYLRLNLIPVSLKEKLVHLTPNFEMLGDVNRLVEDTFKKGYEIRKWEEKYQKKN